MEIQVEVAIIGLIQAIFVAIIGGIFAKDSRKRKKSQDKLEARALIRAEESMLMVQMLSSTMHLGQATANAVLTGQTNGQLTKALDEASCTNKLYQDFINKIAAEQIAKI